MQKIVFHFLQAEYRRQRMRHIPQMSDSRFGNSDVSEAAAFVYLVAKVNGYIAWLANQKGCAALTCSDNVWWDIIALETPAPQRLLLGRDIAIKNCISRTRSSCSARAQSYMPCSAKTVVHWFLKFKHVFCAAAVAMQANLRLETRLRWPLSALTNEAVVVDIRLRPGSGDDGSF